MGPPETTVWEYPMADDSWAAEFAEFLDDIRARPARRRRRPATMRVAALEQSSKRIYEDVRP